jgi:hypothetical protein
MGGTGTVTRISKESKLILLSLVILVGILIECPVPIEIADMILLLNGENMHYNTLRARLDTDVCSIPQLVCPYHLTITFIAAKLST